MNNSEIIQAWLEGKSENTAQVYTRTIEHMLAHVGKPLMDIALPDLRNWQASLTGADNTRKTKVNIVRSLFTFIYDLELAPRNVASKLRPPLGRGRIDEHILTEDDISRIISVIHKTRDKALVRILYATGGRIGEICAMTWGDVEKTKDGGQVYLNGKGNKDRVVKFSANIWAEFSNLRNDATNESPVFLSQKGGHLDPSQAWRIIRAAAVNAGIKGDVSPHWFRHSHASHALENGATLAAVRDTLGHSNVGVTDLYIHARTGDSSSYYLT